MIDRRTSTKSALAQWLAGSDSDSASLLNQCDFYPQPSGELLIDCPSEVLEQVLDLCRKIAQSAIRLEIPQLNLVSDGETICRFQPNLARNYPLPTFADIPLIYQLPDPADEIAIVRMADHRALYTTSNLDKSSKAFNSWTGENMSQWHIPEELKRLVEALDKHQFVQGFTYKAFNYIREPQLLTVNAWLTTWRGQPVRVVQTLNRVRA